MTGTESDLQAADELEESIAHVLGGYHLGQAAERMEKIVKIVRRLAPLDPDIEVTRGEN